MKGLKGKHLVALSAAIALGHPSAMAQTYRLMPQPAELQPGAGQLVIDESFRLALEGYQEPRLEAAAARLIRRRGKRT